MKVKQYLQQKFWYGGELHTLGYITSDLQRVLPNQQCVDRYLQGLLLTQKPKG